jgi:hypothetical protein
LAAERFGLSKVALALIPLEISNASEDGLMTFNSAHRPRYQGGRFLFATDNTWSADRYAVHFSDGIALTIWVGGAHSAWSDLDGPVPHLAGDRVAWSRLPQEIKAEVHRRCDE